MQTLSSNYEQLVKDGSLLTLGQYDKVIVSYSGGKDSLALLLHLLCLGVDHQKIELWHQHIDGAPGQPHFMDWPCTIGYVKATGEAMGLPVRFQWKDGGFHGEMLRENSQTKGMYFEDGDGKIHYCPPSPRGKVQTRRLFPQVSADLSVRWCSAYLKIDVAARAINNDPRFDAAKILFCTGERREESTARSKYEEVEPHRCNNKKRRVDQWRGIIDWKEEHVWDIIKQFHVRAHPAYYIGFGRVSCMACIFGDADQWASVQMLAPKTFYQIAGFEQEFGKTIKKGISVVGQADKGLPYEGCASDELRQLAMSPNYPAEMFYFADDEPWVQPIGAYRRCGGPT